MRGANSRSRCSMARCFGVRFFHLPLAGSSAMTPSTGPDAPSTFIAPASEPFFGFCSSSPNRRPRPWAGPACPWACVFSAVVIAPGAPARNSGSRAVERAGGRQPLRAL